MWGLQMLFAGFHLVLSDGHNQLQGQSRHVAQEVVETFRSIGVRVTWSSDPKEIPSETDFVTVAILPHSSRDWRLAKGALAAVAREGIDSRGSVFLFYPDIARALDFHPARSSSIRDTRPPGVPWHVGVARIVVHEILHFFLPERSHDRSGIFMEHHRTDSLLSPTIEIAPGTRESLRERLRAARRGSMQELSPAPTEPVIGVAWLFEVAQSLPEEAVIEDLLLAERSLDGVRLSWRL